MGTKSWMAFFGQLPLAAGHENTAGQHEAALARSLEAICSRSMVCVLQSCVVVEDVAPFWWTGQVPGRTRAPLKPKVTPISSRDTSGASFCLPDFLLLRLLGHMDGQLRARRFLFSLWKVKKSLSEKTCDSTLDSCGRGVCKRKTPHLHTLQPLHKPCKPGSRFDDLTMSWLQAPEAFSCGFLLLVWKKPCACFRGCRKRPLCRRRRFMCDSIFSLLLRP